MKQIVVTFILFQLLQVVNAQLYTIKGRVAGDSDGEAIEFASIQLHNIKNAGSYNEISDEKGRFIFKAIPPGEYEIQIGYIGSETYRETIIVDRNIDLGSLKLKVKLNELDEVSVMAERAPVEYKIDRRVINVSQQLHAAGGTAIDALQSIPSIQVDADGNIKFRGSSDFTLLIDGRPTILSVSDALNSMLAGNIQQIEIITNPSVKFEAEGNTGIINIITKKEFFGGAEGLADFSIANGNKYSVNLLGNKKFQNARIYGGFSSSDKTKINESRSVRESLLLPGFVESISSIRQVLNKSTEIKAGGDWNPGEKDKVSLNLQLGNWESGREVNSIYDSDEITSELKTREYFNNNNKYFSGGINYSHNFSKKGQDLEVDVYWSFLDNEIPNEFEEIENSYFRKLMCVADKKMIRNKIDYTLQLSDASVLEAGAQFSGTSSYYNYYKYDKYGVDNEWIADSLQSAEMDYRFNNTAAYALIKNQNDLFNIQMGLRLEYEDRLLSINNSDDIYSKLSLFPSIHLSKEIGDNQQLGLSYSRRINRPDEWQLNPLINSSDHFMKRRGNPDLLPEITNALEITFFRRAKKVDVHLQSYYKHIINVISPFIEYLDSSYIDSYDNLDVSRQLGSDIMLEIEALEWLKLNFSISAYYTWWRGSLNDETLLENSAFVNMGNFRLNFMLSKNTYLQFLTVFYAPGRMPQGSAEGFYYYDFILKQQLFEKRLSITLRTHNTFNSGMLHYKIDGLSFKSENWYLYEGPTFILSLNYNLNNFRPAKSRKVEIDYDSGYDH